MAWPSECGSLAAVRPSPTFVSASAAARTFVKVPFARRRYGRASWLWRGFHTAEYRFYRRKDVPPEEDTTTFATSSSLPDAPTPTFDDGTWFVSVSRNNGLYDSGFLPIGPAGEPYYRLEISGGDEQPQRPRAPFGVRARAIAGGVVRVDAFYVETGTDRATEWAIAYTTDGSDPAEDSPDVTVSMTGGAAQALSHELPAQSDGTTVKLIVQARRNDGGYVYNRGSTIVTVVADDSEPDDVLSSSTWRGTGQDV